MGLTESTDVLDIVGEQNGRLIYQVRKLGTRGRKRLLQPYLPWGL